MKKKLTSILVLCVMFFTLTLPVSAAQTVSKERQPRVLLSAVSSTLITSVSASQAILEEKQPQKCEYCGKMTSSTVKLGDYEVGPDSVTCAHGYPYGDDLVYKKYTSYQYQCSDGLCSYKSQSWDTYTGAVTECHGHR
ncbi:MAG: hypothetical protein HFH50_06325 [Lachnospiraceae bacterium]|jgi:hypothetical protein|nr:hypothetical protein [Lachnospiraceae bacterium]